MSPRGVPGSGRKLAFKTTETSMPEVVREAPIGTGDGGSRPVSDLTAQRLKNVARCLERLARDLYTGDVIISFRDGVPNGSIRLPEQVIRADTYGRNGDR